ncbi:hypothetical protein ATI61_106353 [Archangium gephyra]|uniref:Uncharacterized protein n=1 Tax=Archangium gephyra TaxID=48 RepID=A0AAC8Q0W8_9BACT|nr:hypothetical protein [Archangium gephyra]AKI98974.1 Hypothetical protein AA314_00601 [Archangium gephyra]REG30883.1 hypothetical protein ATI61_106353 [Archangium gephyra]
MEKKTRTRGGKVQNGADGGFEQQLGPLTRAIDDAVAGIPDQKQRREVRQAVGEAVHGAMKDLAHRAKAPKELLGPTAGAIERGTNAIKQVKELGFVEFTAGLINGTFDAIVGATIKQMEAYADMVARLAKTLTDFQADHISPADITKHLADTYPDGVGGTSVRHTYEFVLTAANDELDIPERTARENLILVGEALAKEVKSVSPDFTFDPTKHIQAGKESFTEAWVTDARAAVGRLLAKSMIEHLRAMAREGMARIVVTDGELLSRLTFKVNATEREIASASRYDAYSSEWSAGAGYKGKRFRASFGYSSSNMHVSTVDESTFDDTTMTAEIIGQVKINFRTESFPPYIKDGPIE